MNYEEMQLTVQKTALKAYEEKLVAGTSGNVSVYDRETGVMAITPTNMDYRIMRPEDVVLLKLDGTIVKGDLKPSSEWRLHAGIYAGIEEANAVIHTHSQYATGFAVTHEKVPLILVEMLPFLGGDIPVADFGLPGTDEVGINAVRALKDPKRNACLLANHGVVAYGKNIDQAYVRAVYVEDAATIYAHALQSGGKITLIPKTAEKILRERYHLGDR
ncbi:MAG: class II aldolase/adducin family protein [Sphaerochaetaceae bacterium]|nr:class II aldolase/adducin family protein [Sphaerochaetaceae bacterium]